MFDRFAALKQNTRNLQIGAPRAESGIVHRVVDARIALSRLEWQIVDKIKMPFVFGQRGVDVAAHISSYLLLDIDGLAGSVD